MKKTIIFFILLLAFSLRLYKINNPVADWHSWRQADTAAVARNFLKFGFDPLRPRYDDLSNIASGQDNPMGWRMVEFPLYQLIGAGLFRFFGIFSIEIWLRLLTISAAVGSVYFVYKIGEKFINPRFGTIAGLLFAVLPYSVYYGRAILPESLAVFLALGSVYFLILSSKNYDKNNTRTLLVVIILSAVFGGLSLLVKPTAGFILLPIIYLTLKKHGLINLLTLISTYIFLFCVFAPFALWRSWIQNFPEGIPVYEWLLNGDGIRLKGAWFYWLFGERIAKLILGYWGIFLLGSGILYKRSRNNYAIFHWFGLGALLYLIIFATGNVKHDYYQIIIIPTIIFYAALGIEFLLFNANKLFNKYYVFVFSCFCVILTFALSWHEIRTFYWINNSKIVKAGAAADKILPKGAKVIASYSGDTAFLYQINRQGWPLGFEIEDKIKKGATHYVSINPTGPEEVGLKNEYKVLKENENFIIIEFSRNSHKFAY